MNEWRGKQKHDHIRFRFKSCLPNVAVKFASVITTHEPFPKCRVKESIGTVTSVYQESTDQLKHPPHLFTEASATWADSPWCHCILNLVHCERVERCQTNWQHGRRTVERSDSCKSQVHLELEHLGKVDGHDAVPGPLQHQWTTLNHVEN